MLDSEVHRIKIATSSTHELYLESHLMIFTVLIAYNELVSMWTTHMYCYIHTIQIHVHDICTYKYMHKYSDFLMHKYSNFLITPCAHAQQGVKQSVLSVCLSSVVNTKIARSEDLGI